MKYHAVMIDECGGEFGVDLEAPNRDAAYDQLAEDYPESRVDQLEDPEQARAREDSYYDGSRNWDAQARYDQQW